MDEYMTGTTPESRKWLPPKAVFGFLLPNFLGFFCFTLFPVLFSLFMVFTNWTLKPAVAFKVVGLRNLNDLLWVRPLGEGHAAVCALYVVCAFLLLAALVGSLWSHVAGWKGARVGGAILLMLTIPIGIAASLGLAILLSDELPSGPARQRIVLSLLCFVAGVATFLVLLGLGHGNLAFLGGLFWFIALLGCAFGVVSYRTVYYLPHFTTGNEYRAVWWE